MFLPGVTDELDTYLGTLDDELRGLRATVSGLTEQQVRERTTRSALSLGGILKHVTFGVRMWAARLAAAPNRCAEDEDFDARIQEWTDSFALGPDETLEGALTAYDEAIDSLFAVLRTRDFGKPMYYPPQPWFGLDASQISVRWGVAHLLAEVAHHAGHADIIREQLDGATTESLAGITWEPPTEQQP